jgi:sulfur carrier protein ThiS
MKLYASGHISFYMPDRRSKMNFEIKEPTRLNEVLAELGIPLAEVHLVVVNGQLADLKTVYVVEQDEVKLYPAVNGG